MSDFQIKLDLGCGGNKKPGFIGVDSIAFPGVDMVCDLSYRNTDDVWDRTKYDGNGELTGAIVEKKGEFSKWPWRDNTVVEAHSSHFVEHLDAIERVHFVNELYRVLVPGGKAQIIVPHWASCRAYGDPTHKWPPVSEFFMYYLSREWRMGNPTKKCGSCPGHSCQRCGGNGTFALGANAPHTDKSHWSAGFDCDFDATWGYGMHPEIVMKSQPYQQFAMQWYKEAVSDIIATLTKR